MTKPGDDSSEKVWLRDSVWRAVASEIGELHDRGLRHLLTEETIRFATVKALVEAGVDAADLQYEHPYPKPLQGRIDLVIGAPPSALLEFKYPRERDPKNEAWPTFYGEVLRDLYRLASYPDRADRLFVLVLPARFRDYLRKKDWPRLGGDEVTVTSHDADLLPRSASAALAAVRENAGQRTISGRQLCAPEIDNELGFYVYDVSPWLFNAFFEKPGFRDALLHYLAESYDEIRDEQAQ